MNSNKLSATTLFIIIIVLFTSCRELVTSEFPDYESLPVVNSILEQGKPITVHLSLAGGLDSLPLPTIENASVELFVDGQFTENLEPKGQGWYISSTLVVPLKEYKCKVIVPGEDTIVCSQTLPVSDQIVQIEHINIAGRDQEGTTYPAIKLTFKNDRSARRYYEISINYFTKHYSWDEEEKKYLEDYLEARSVQLQNISDPVILNEGLPIMLFSNELIQDSTYTMTLNYTTGASSSSGGSYRTTLFPLVVELRSVTYDYYRFQKQYYLYNEGRQTDGLTRVMTAFPLYSNIENGNGIFAGYSVFVSDTITPEPYEN
jgi:hypothetical protein